MSMLFRHCGQPVMVLNTRKKFKSVPNIMYANYTDGQCCVIEFDYIRDVVLTHEMNSLALLCSL